MLLKWCYCVNVTFFHVGKNGMGMVGKVYPEGVEIFQVELNLLYKRVVPISGFSSSPLGVCHAFLMADIFKDFSWIYFQNTQTKMDS